MAANAGVPIMGLYGGYKGYSDRRDEGSAKEFSLRMVCPVGNIGSVIGKGGAIIKQIRQESRASIKVDSSGAEGDDCIIFISAKEVWIMHLYRICVLMVTFVRNLIMSLLSADDINVFLRSVF